MKVRIHRGANEIGGTCIEIAQDGERLALDLGVPLDGDSDDSALVPPIAGDGLRAVVISHPHLDHYGLLHHLPHQTPVAIGNAARNILCAAAPFTGQPLPNLAGYTLEHRKTLEVGTFRITPYLVDHSAFDAYAMLIEAGGKRLFYSGDFRAHGRKGKLFEEMVVRPPSDVDVLLMEGSSLTRLASDERFPTEQELEERLVTYFKEAPGTVLMHTSAQNIDRVVTAYRACKRSRKVLIIDLYAAAILEATGNRHIPQSDWEGVALFVPEWQRRLVKKNAWFELLQRHSRNRIFPGALQALAPRSVVLFRPLMMRDLEEADALHDARFIYSQWRGYLEAGSYREMECWLTRHGIPIEYVHTSGHASPVDLKRFAAAVAPKAIVPIHSFAPEKYAEMFADVVYRGDGEWWEV